MSQAPKAAKDADDAWEDHYKQEQATIAALSFEEARQQAELLLADPQKFDCVSAASNETFDIFAPGLQSLFSRFESIQVVNDEAYLDRQEIELLDMDGNGLTWGLPLWKIGYADGHTLALVTPNDERVYEMYDSDELGEPFLSIYHWLLWVSAVASNFGLAPELIATTKSGQHIVSKGRFVVDTGYKAALASCGGAIILIGFVSIVVLCVMVLPLLWPLRWSSILGGLLALVLLGGGSWILLCIGKEVVKEAKEMDVGVPLTRANTAHLPAADSLSQEPVHEQENVLLRATGESREDT